MVRQLKVGVPSSFGNLTCLRHLDMSYTQTNQWLPELFLRLSGSRKSLEVLGLNDNSLFGSIVNVTTFSSLKKLYLQNNVLNGFFIERPGQVSTLEYLVLSDNQMRGPLPDLSLFPSLRELHLGSNQFQGKIPQGIGKLSQLRILDVSSNGLDGLPESMGKLSNLESFDASYNVLKGTITESHLSNLSSLVYLDLSFNSLALKTSFDWLPPFQLPGYAPTRPHIDHDSNTNSQEHEEEEEFPSLEFYISMVLGFFIRFWGILGCLIVNRWLHMTSTLWFARLKIKLNRA